MWRAAGSGVRSGVPALAKGAVEGRRARGARWSAALRSRPLYLSRAAGPGSLLPEEPPALSPAPPAWRPRGFVYGLGLFSEAPAALAPLAVAQPLAGGNLKPRCGSGRPLPLHPWPLALLLPPPGQLLQLGERGRALGKLHTVLLQLLAWRGAGRRRLDWLVDRFGAGVGKRDRSPPNPELSQSSPGSRQAPPKRGPDTAPRSPEPGRGSGAQPPGLSHYLEPALRWRRGHRQAGVGRRDSPPPHPAPELLQSLLSGRPVSRVAKEEDGSSVAAGPSGGSGEQGQSPTPLWTP